MQWRESYRVAQASYKYPGIFGSPDVVSIVTPFWPCIAALVASCDRCCIPHFCRSRTPTKLTLPSAFCFLLKGVYERLGTKLVLLGFRAQVFSSRHLSDRGLTLTSTVAEIESDTNTEVDIGTESGLGVANGIGIGRNRHRTRNRSRNRNRNRNRNRIRNSKP